MIAKAQRILLPRNPISPLTILRLAISILLCLTITACALPNKFTGLVQPPKDNVLVYLYTSGVDKSYNLDNTVVSYSLNELEKRRLPAGASHAQSVPAGKISIRNHAKTKTRTLSIWAEKNQTIFVYFKPIIDSRSGSSIKFGHAISIHRNTEKTKNQAVELLSKTRVYYFNNKGEEFAFDQTDNKDSQSIANLSQDQRNKTTKAAGTEAPAKAISSSAIDASESITMPTAIADQPILNAVNTPSKPATVALTESTANRSVTPTLSGEQRSQIADSALEEINLNSKTEEKLETLAKETAGANSKSAKAVPATAIPVTASTAASWPDFQAAAKRKTFSRFKVSCKKPFRFTQGCSALSITNTVFKIDGHKLKMAASADGKIIYIEPAQTLSNAAKQIFTLSLAADKQKTAINEGIEAVKQLLLENDISILETYEVIERKRRSGWIFATDADSYQLLKDHNQ